MRHCTRELYKTPKNAGVAPRFDIWNEKYEPWVHMRQMGKLVGTGFYIPPEWYNHFRMFPPIHHNFQQEKTLNPQNESEPTQDDKNYRSAERIALREELARKSRLLASEGMRYYNIFWIRKPLDRMEKEYYDLKRRGVDHATALKKVLQIFYNELTVKKRVAAIQAEEAKLSGKFITMREAVVVMRVLATMQNEQLTPHQVNMLAQEQSKAAHFAPLYSATVSYNSDETTADKQNSEEFAQTTETNGDGNNTSSKEADNRSNDTTHTPQQPAPGSHDANNTSKTGKEDASKMSSSEQNTSSNNNSTSSSLFSADHLAQELTSSIDAMYSGSGQLSKQKMKVEFTATPHDSAVKLQQMATDQSGSLTWYSGASPFLDLTETDSTTNS